MCDVEPEHTPGTPPGTGGDLWCSWRISLELLLWLAGKDMRCGPERDISAELCAHLNVSNKQRKHTVVG